MDRSSNSSYENKSFRTQPMSPITSTATGAVRKAQIVGSPVNFRKQPQQLLTGASPSNKKPLSHIHALQTPHAFAFGSDANSNRRARPATSAASTAVAPLTTTATLNVLLASYDDPQQQLLYQQQARPDSAPETRIRKQPGSVAPLSISSAFGSQDHQPGLSSPLPLMQQQQRQSQRCAGCGAFAEMCMGCFSRFKLQDGAVYKKQIIRSVEVLFEKATARAFTKMSAVILQWLFGIWKRETQLNRRRRAAALRGIQRQKLHRWFTTWHECIYKRRIVGAMLYAENQQQVTRDKVQEIAQLHGDVFAITSDSSVQSQVHGDELAKLQLLCATQQQNLLAKNQELLTLRRELQEVHGRVAILEKQVVDPKELERLKGESVNYKKVAFQLANAVFQNMESQVEQLATSEGRHNLSQVFTKEILQTLDKPECQAFYNPLVELESAPMAAATAPAGTAASNLAGTSGQPGSETTSGSGQVPTSFFASYDAPTDRAEKILMQWVNALVQKQGLEWLPAPRMLNFHSSLTDGKLYVVLTKILHQAMCKVRSKRPPGVVSSKLEATSVLRENGEDLTEIAMERYLEHMKRDESPEKRLELLIGTIGQALWLPVGLLNTKDILAGDAEFNFATLSYLFTTFSPCLDDSFYALCNDLKMQLTTAKAKWRELREGVPTGAPSTTSSSGNLKLSRASTSKDDAAAAAGNGGSEDSTLSSKIKLVLAHTMELKRKIDLEDQKAREGHVIWWKSLRIVTRKCFLSYARLARGKAGVLTRLDASSDENEAFSKVPKHKIQDLELPFEDFTWETKLLQSYLLTIYCDLARIYRGYATRNGVMNDVISLGDFMELLTECRVLDANFTANDVSAIIRKLDPKQVQLKTIKTSTCVGCPFEEDMWATDMDMFLFVCLLYLAVVDKCERAPRFTTN